MIPSIKNISRWRNLWTKMYDADSGYFTTWGLIKNCLEHKEKELVKLEEFAEDYQQHKENEKLLDRTAFAMSLATNNTSVEMALNRLGVTMYSDQDKTKTKSLYDVLHELSIKWVELADIEPEE